MDITLTCSPNRLMGLPHDRCLQLEENVPYLIAKLAQDKLQECTIPSPHTGSMTWCRSAIRWVRAIFSGTTLNSQFLCSGCSAVNTLLSQTVTSKPLVDLSHNNTKWRVQGLHVHWNRHLASQTHKVSPAQTQSTPSISTEWSDRPAG